LVLSVIVWGLVVAATIPLPRRVGYRLCRYWANAAIFLLKLLCGLDYAVEGRERLPKRNAVVLVKHSSTWEAIVQWKIFPTQTWVIKRELMWVPILGWALRALRPIAINRSAGRSAVQQVIEQGKRCLADGLWVVIFPEGTRVPAGRSGRYGISGALLASEAGTPVVPVAHNAGDYWPRRSWLKRAGTIKVVIGDPIPTAGREPREVTEEVREWIEKTLAEIRPAP